MGVAQVPMVDPGRAAVEVAEAIAVGCGAILVPSEPAREFSPTHPDYDGVWAGLADAGVPFMLHLGGGGKTLCTPPSTRTAGGSRGTEAYAALGELSDEGRSRFGANSLVFDTPDGFVFVPDQCELQCVASTTRGARCRNVVFDQGQVWVYDVGPIARLDERWLARLLTQTCLRHDEVQADHYAPTECVFIPRNDVSPEP